MNRLKLVWRLLIVAGFGAFVWQTTEILLAYISEPTGISMVHTKQLLPLTDLTLCKEPIFDHVNNNTEFWESVLRPIREPLTSKTLTKLVDIVAVENKSPEHLLHIDWTKYISAHSYACNKSIIKCSMNYQVFNCCDYFKDIETTLYGKCFYVNDFYRIAPIYSPESKMGLKLLVRCKSNGGIYLGFPDVYSAISVSCNKKVWIALHPKRLQRQQRRIGGCVGERHIPTLRQSPACEVQVLHDAIETACKCTTGNDMTKKQNVTLCNPYHLLDCKVKSNRDLAKAYEERVKSCSNQLCVQWSFNPTQSIMPLTAEYINDIYSDEQNATFLLLTIYYPQLGYKELREQFLLSPQTVVSSIGGQMGLFMGGSLISIIQVVTYGVKYVLANKGKMQTIEMR